MTRRRNPPLPAVLAAVSLALVAAAGCTKILGLDYTYEGTGVGGSSTTATTATTTGTGGAAMCGSFVWDTEASCQSCMQKECCGELLACTTGTPCATLAACAAGCAETDNTCLGACLTTDTNEHAGSGDDAYYALTSCFAEDCQGPPDCSFPVCDSNFTWSISACAACLGSNCCAEFSACNSTASPDPVCVDCIENPAGADCGNDAAFVAAQACLSTTCGPVCADTICTTPELFYTSPRCNYCLSNATTGCCTQAASCAADTDMGMGMDMHPTCSNCFFSGAATCDADAAYSAFGACYESSCSVECSGFF